MLYILGGLPGTGKSTLARALARERRAALIRVDTLEQAMRDGASWTDGPAGYVAAYAVAAENLRLGLDVVADSVNSIEETREAWRQTATGTGTRFCEIEVVCSDREEHRHRVESRRTDVVGLELPSWADVCARRYEPWLAPHVVVDTAHRTPAQALAEIGRVLGRF